MTNDPTESASRPVAVCDACVLYSITMADLLTSLGGPVCITRAGRATFTRSGFATS